MDVTKNLFGAILVALLMFGAPVYGTSSLNITSNPTEIGINDIGNEIKDVGKAIEDVGKEAADVGSSVSDTVEGTVDKVTGIFK